MKLESFTAVSTCVLAGSLTGAGAGNGGGSERWSALCKKKARKAILTAASEINPNGDIKNMCISKTWKMWD